MPKAFSARFSYPGLLAFCLMLQPMIAGAESTAYQDAAGNAACFSPPIDTRISSVSNHGDIELASGHIVHLADISLPDGPPWRNRALERLTDLAGKPVRVSLSSLPDRWRRHRAVIVAAERDLALTMIDAGLALTDAGEATELCNAVLLAVEQKARDGRTGLWSDTANLPVRADASEELLQREGRFTLVTGRIVSVGIRKKWVYLNFGRDWKNDFTVTVSSTVWSRMQARRPDAGNLKDRLVRIRGTIRRWNGPSMEILSPDALELIDQVRDRT